MSKNSRIKNCDDYEMAIPNFNFQNQANELMYAKRPIVISITSITENTLEDFRNDCLEIEESQKIIPIIINSYGGDAYTLLGMIDIIETLKKSGKIIMTICNSKAMSAGSLLLACGTQGYRYASRYSSIMVHDISTYMDGKYEELKSNMKEIERINDIFFKLLDEACSQNYGYFRQVVKNNSSADLYLTLEEAINHNIIDKIGYPNLKPKVSVDFEMNI